MDPYLINKKKKKKMKKEKMLLGYKIEKKSIESGKVGYFLIGKKATYQLVRRINNPKYLYAVNSNLNVCSIKGNYTFNDENENLIAVS